MPIVTVNSTEGLKAGDVLIKADVPREIIREFEERAWDGDPRRRQDDPLCQRARKFLDDTRGPITPPLHRGPNDLTYRGLDRKSIGDTLRGAIVWRGHSGDHETS